MKKVLYLNQVFIVPKQCSHIAADECGDVYAYVGKPDLVGNTYHHPESYYPDGFLATTFFVGHLGTQYPFYAHSLQAIEELPHGHFTESTH